MDTFIKGLKIQNNIYKSLKILIEISFTDKYHILIKDNCKHRVEIKSHYIMLAYLLTYVSERMMVPDD